MKIEITERERTLLIGAIETKIEKLEKNERNFSKVKELELLRKKLANLMAYSAHPEYDHLR